MHHMKFQNLKAQANLS